jgi:hypothetical protein
MHKWNFDLFWIFWKKIFLDFFCFFWIFFIKYIFIMFLTTSVVRCQQKCKRWECSLFLHCCCAVWLRFWSFIVCKHWPPKLILKECIISSKLPEWPRRKQAMPNKGSLFCIHCARYRICVWATRDLSAENIDHNIADWIAHSEKNIVTHYCGLLCDTLFNIPSFFHHNVFSILWKFN